MKPIDTDIFWALKYLEDDADICSEVNGPNDETTKDARRLETTFKRIIREAGYDQATSPGAVQMERN